MLKRKRERKDFNELMNPKNRYYLSPPDFQRLGSKYKAFGKFVYKNKYGNNSIDWRSKEAMRELCRCLLIEDFGLSFWSIPEGFLIPSITSRCNYVCWIHDLLELFLLEKSGNVVGLDIGTGASCIYPLLGRQTYGWSFRATDINKDSMEVARKILQENQIEDIGLELQKDSSRIFDNIVAKSETFFFSMCNPPYFTLEESKHDNPNTACDYNELEVYCEGGESQFIARMIEESIVYKYNVVWFTSLVGKKQNLYKLIDQLSQTEGVQKVIDTTFYQGKIVRWGLAWTFFDSVMIKRKFGANKKQKPFSAEKSSKVSRGEEIEEIEEF